MNAFVTTSDLNGPWSILADDRSGSGSFTVPDGQFLFHAEFKRVGFDLNLTGEDGRRVVVPDYSSTRSCRRC